MKPMLYSLAALVLCAPLAAQAAEGWVVDDISLQAGPDPTYPSITELAAGTPVAIQGCIDGWTWCDVIVGVDRGWVPGTFLEEDYGGQRVVVIDYGPRVGIPVVSFSLGLYWDQHYHSRPFYSQRQEWVAKAIQPRQPQRPANAVAHSNTPQHAPPATTANQQRTKPMQQQQTMATRAAAPRHPEHPEATPPEAGKQPSQTEKREASHEPATVAKAKPRAGEPKPADELKKGKPKNKDDKPNQDGGGER
jgi:uncharacterized protein YraI